VNCEEFRQRIVDPSSASTGGHAPVVDHLQACADCRSLARSFTEVEKLFSAAERADPPNDLDDQIRRQLARPARGPLAGLSDRRVLGAAVLVVGTAAFLLLRSRAGSPPRAPAPPPATSKAPVAPNAPRAQAPPPEILAIHSTPISVGEARLSDTEKARALGLHPREFLEYSGALGSLDPFFPEVLPAVSPGAVRPPESPEETAQRLADWEEAGPAGRERWLALDAAYRATNPAKRKQIEERWHVVAGFSPVEKAGLRRLATRLADLNERLLARLEAEIRTLSRLPPRERRVRWRALPFARDLTGQELAAGEKLLLSF
jgi:hypothetical protein